MGMVYQATDQRLGLTIAIKVLRTDGRDDRVRQSRFRQEVLAGRQISHPGVVRIHDLERDGELSFLTMDFVPGRTLRDWLGQRGPLPLEKALEVLRQLASALAAAHRMGVVHRDLKPSNILLDAEGVPYITDFGVARTLSSAGLSAGLTHTGEVMGTPEYLAPEQARGQRVDHRADIYSLGLIFFEMLTGEPAFSGEHVGERLAHRLLGPPRALSETGIPVPDYLEAVVSKCLQRDPDDRYPSCEKLLADLAGQRAPAARRWPLSRAAVTGSLLGLTVAIALVLLVVWTARDSKPGHRGVLEGVSGGTSKGTSVAEPAPGTERSRPAPRHAVVVLPPAPPDGSAESADWLSTALPEMLTSALRESPDLRVVDSLRVTRTLRDLRLPAGRLPPSELVLLAELFDVDRIVLPRVWAIGQGAQVELLLIDPARPESSEVTLREEASGPDLLRLPARLSEKLREGLDAQTPIHPRSAVFSEVAMTAYAQGLDFLGRGDSLGALPWFQQAVAKEPTYTEAWVSLARTHQSLGRRPQALDAARTAVELSAGASGRTSFEARARLASLQGESTQTQELLEELVARFPHDVESRVVLAEAYGEAGEYGRADNVLAQVVLEDPNHPRAWYLRGKYSILAGAPQRAADDFLVRALVVQNRLGNEQGQGEVLNALGAAHQKLGELGPAEERYREAVEIRQRIGDRRGAAATLTNLADIQQLRGQFDGARAHLEEARSHYLDLGDRRGMGVVENQLGFLEEQRGLYPRALDHFHEALVLYRGLGHQRKIAESHEDIGFAYFVLGEPENADLHWREALDLYRETGYRAGEAETLQVLAQLAMTRGRWEDALAGNLEALELARELKLAQIMAVATAHLGRVAQHRGRYGAALSSYAEALDLLADFEDPRGWTELTLYRADALIEIGAFDQGWDKLTQTDPWIDRTGHQDHRAERQRLEAQIELARGRLERARPLVERAREEARTSGALALQLSAELSAGRLALAAGQAEQAVGILRPVLVRANRLDHAVLRAEVGAVLAEAEGATDRLAEAETTIREALDLAYSRAPMAITWRLHWRYARVLEARGAVDDAQGEIDKARAEVQRIRESLEPDQREHFDRLPEVADILSS